MISNWAISKSNLSFLEQNRVLSHNSVSFHKSTNVHLINYSTKDALWCWYVWDLDWRSILQCEYKDIWNESLFLSQKTTNIVAGTGIASRCCSWVQSKGHPFQSTFIADLVCLNASESKCKRKSCCHGEFSITSCSFILFVFKMGIFLSTVNSLENLAKYWSWSVNNYK